MIRAIVLIVLVAIGTAACKPATPSYSVTDPVTGEKTKVSIKDQAGNKTINVESQAGAGSVSIAQQGEAPQNLPSYLPPYPGAQYMGSFAAASTKSEVGGPVAGGMVSFTTQDPGAKVLAFYKEALIKSGMTEQASGDMGGMTMLSFSKGDNEQEGAQVMVTANPTGGTQVQILYSAPP